MSKQGAMYDPWILLWEKAKMLPGDKKILCYITETFFLILQLEKWAKFLAVWAAKVNKNICEAELSHN